MNVVIKYNSTDITNSVIMDQTNFEQQMNAVPGSFQITVRDEARTLSFSTGKEVTLDIDGSRLFGGYVTQVSMTHLASVGNTSNLSTYKLRAWVLRGTDYNIIFDRRVVRNTADYLSAVQIPITTDGAELRTIVGTYSDCSDFTTTGILDIATLPGTGNDFVQQGTPLRQWFENMSFFGGAVWYIDGNKNFVYEPYDNATKRWGFSDTPNRNPITVSPTTYQGATYGFRDVEAIEDGSYIENDVLVWGGSEFAGSSGGTVFSRRTNSTSISTYGRWQYAETHFGENYYKTQAGVDARSDVVVNGPPGADANGLLKGLRFSQWQFTFTWFSHEVPTLSGVRDHVVAGQILNIAMNAFGVNQLLPVRSLRTTFPGAKLSNGDWEVQFDATFGLQLSDPFTLWRFLLNTQTKLQQAAVIQVNAVTSGSTSTTYGATYTGPCTPTPDGAATIFSIPFGYISGTLQVFMNGLIQRSGIDYTESNNVAGQFTMTSAPISTDSLWVICSTLSS